MLNYSNIYLLKWLKINMYTLYIYYFYVIMFKILIKFKKKSYCSHSGRKKKMCKIHTIRTINSTKTDISQQETIFCEI